MGRVLECHLTDLKILAAIFANTLGFAGKMLGEVLSHGVSSVRM